MTIFFRKKSTKFGDYVYLTKKPTKGKRRKDILVGRIEDLPLIAKELKRFLKKLEKSDFCLL